MTRKTGLGLRLVYRFTVCELTKSPASGCGVPFRILDHELHVSWRPGNERLLTTKDFVVLLGRNVFPSQTGNNCSIWKWKLCFPKSLDRLIVAQDGANIVEIACLVGYGDQFPVPVSSRNSYLVVRRSFFVGVSSCG